MTHDAFINTNGAMRNLLHAIHAMPSRTVRNVVNGDIMHPVADVLRNAGGYDPIIADMCAGEGFVRIAAVGNVRFVRLTDKGRAAVGFMQTDDAIRALSECTNPAVMAAVDGFRADRERFAAILEGPAPAVR